MNAWPSPFERTLLLASFASALGFGMLLPLLPLYLSATGSSATLHAAVLPILFLVGHVLLRYREFRCRYVAQRRQRLLAHEGNEERGAGLRGDPAAFRNPAADRRPALGRTDQRGSRARGCIDLLVLALFPRAVAQLRSVRRALAGTRRVAARRASISSSTCCASRSKRGIVGGHIECASPHFYALLAMSGYLAGTCLSTVYTRWLHRNPGCARRDSCCRTRLMNVLRPQQSA